MKLTVITFLLWASTLSAADMQPGAVFPITSLKALPISYESMHNAGDGIVFQYLQEPYKLFYFNLPEGKTVNVIDLKQVENEWRGDYGQWTDYASDGKSVYVLWDRAAVVHEPISECPLSRFDVDGHYKGTVLLEGRYGTCFHLAVLDGDTVVMSGTATDDSPFVGTFKTNGQLIRRLQMPGDIRIVDDPKKEKRDPLELDDHYMMSNYESDSILDSDGDGNVVLTRRFLDLQPPDSPQDTKYFDHAMFVISRDGTVKRFVLEKPKTKLGRVLQVRVMRGHVVTMSYEQEKAADFAHDILRVFDFDGKKVAEYRVAPELGMILVHWDDHLHRALFASQDGDVHLKVKNFALREGIPQ